MRSYKKFTKILLGIFCIIALSVGTSYFSAHADEDSLYLGGFPAGFMLNTQTVTVIGLTDLPMEFGSRCPAREGGIKSGDVIKSINGIEITSATQLTEILKEDFAEYKLSVLRGGETVELSLQPIKDENTGKKKLGLLVKDSINGIGTITYIDKANNKFASLGHPVTDETGGLVAINGGCLYGCSIYDVKKGLRGNPGELKGIFDNSQMLGVVKCNTKCGIYGDISSDFDVSNLTAVRKGCVSDASVGKAYIYSTLGGNKAEQYEISLVKVDEHNKDNRNYVIKITDKRILERSGGIVQGMSGSPIVQNGKIIGAVTHVFVNDPTRGYGIGIEHMLNAY